MKTIKFSKGYIPCAILSLVIILSGIFVYIFRGINLGLEFKPGIMEQISITGKNGKIISADDVRNAVLAVSNAEVKEISGGTGETKYFQIKIDASSSSKDSTDSLFRNLYDTFGVENVNKIRTDIIGSQFSVSLIKKTIFLVAGALILIWIYALIRFRWDYALGAIIALLHDSLIIFAFIVWTKMEFTTTTIAAILTIIGYSINATVVILDRLRENIAKNPEETNIIILLDKSLSETFSRSIITTVTTMFASISLFIFTTGSIHDFASALNVGLISGCYSSIFISSGFIALVYKIKQKKITSCIFKSQKQSLLYKKFNLKI